MTKAEYRQHRKDWTRGLIDGRIVSTNNGLTETMYPSVEWAQRELLNASADASAHMVDVSTWFVVVSLSGSVEHLFQTRENAEYLKRSTESVVPVSTWKQAQQ